jgi:hypothetical protein
VVTFPAEIAVPVRNQITGASYRLIRANELPMHEAMFGAIADICSERKSIAGCSARC